MTVTICGVKVEVPSDRANVAAYFNGDTVEVYVNGERQ